MMHACILNDKPWRKDGHYAIQYLHDLREASGGIINMTIAALPSLDQASCRRLLLPFMRLADRARLELRTANAGIINTAT